MDLFSKNKLPMVITAINVTGTSSWSTDSAYAFTIEALNGYLCFLQINGQHSSTDGVTVTIAGLDPKVNSSIVVGDNGKMIGRAQVTAGSSSIATYLYTDSTSRYIEGWIFLASKPTWLE